LVSEYTLDGYTPTTTPMKDLTIPPSSQIEAINGGTARVVDPTGDSPAPNGTRALHLLTSASRHLDRRAL
jgi:hypothetical protein